MQFGLCLCMFTLFLTLKVFAIFFACEALAATYTYTYRHLFACIHGLQLLLLLLLMLMWLALSMSGQNNKNNFVNTTWCVQALANPLSLSFPFSLSCKATAPLLWLLSCILFFGLCNCFCVLFLFCSLPAAYQVSGHDVILNHVQSVREREGADRPNDSKRRVK